MHPGWTFASEIVRASADTPEGEPSTYSMAKWPNEGHNSFNYNCLCRKSLPSLNYDDRTGADTRGQERTRVLQLLQGIQGPCGLETGSGAHF